MKTKICYFFRPILLCAVLLTIGCASNDGGGSESAAAAETPATPPTVTGVSASNANATYGVGAVINVQVTFSQAVVVTGTPQITLSTGTPTTTAVNYSSGSGSSTLTFNYTIASGNSSADLDYSSTGALTLNGGSIKNSSGTNATLTLAAPAAAGSLGANKSIVVDGVAPGVTSVSSSTANGSYTTGQTVSIQVVFGTVVNVTGTPQLTLSTGTPATTAVNYVSGTGTNTLNFTYTVAAGNNSADLDYATTGALGLNGGTIRDGALNNAVLTLPTPGTTNSLGNNKAIVVDTAVPTVSSVTSSKTDGTYWIGEIISIQVVFSEIVNVTGTPQLTLSTGTPATTAINYASGTGTNTLNFTYTVAAGNGSTDLDYASTGALGLNGGTIRDAALNNATLTLAAPAAANSLGANKAIVINASTWARSTAAGTNVSVFNAIASDSSGNSYAVGYQYGNGTYTYGSQSIAASATTSNNAVLVKYDSTGTAQWARTVSAGASTSQFYAVAVDSSGNVYAAGSQNGTGNYSYDGLFIAGPNVGPNIILVKYNSSGTSQWARTVNSASAGSSFRAVAVDSSGNIYAAGDQSGTSTFTYGSQTATGSCSTSNVLLVKYASNGTPQWARTMSAGSVGANFEGVTVDSSGNIYAAGIQQGTGTYNYGGQTVAGTHTSLNVLLVKYDSAGTTQWARSVSAGSAISFFKSVAVDSSGDVYAAGSQTGLGAFTYGGQSATGTHTGDNVVLVKYNSSGTAQWARTTSAGGANAQFQAVIADSTGGIYAAGYQTGIGTFTFGSQSTNGSSTGNNVTLVKYNSSGTAQWARTMSAGSNNARFQGLAADSLGNIFAVGYQATTGAYTYSGESAAGTYSGNNAVIVKYN